VYNGGAQDVGLLNETWDGIVLPPVLDDGKPGGRDKRRKGGLKSDGDE
jgi:hypothetical protein